MKEFILSNQRFNVPDHGLECTDEITPPAWAVTVEADSIHEAERAAREFGFSLDAGKLLHYLVEVKDGEVA